MNFRCRFFFFFSLFVSRLFLYVWAGNLRAFTPNLYNKVVKLRSTCSEFTFQFKFVSRADNEGPSIIFPNLSVVIIWTVWVSQKRLHCVVSKSRCYHLQSSRKSEHIDRELLLLGCVLLISCKNWNQLDPTTDVFCLMPSSLKGHEIKDFSVCCLYTCPLRSKTNTKSIQQHHQRSKFVRVQPNHFIANKKKRTPAERWRHR